MRHIQEIHDIRDSNDWLDVTQISQRHLEVELNQRTGQQRWRDRGTADWHYGNPPK